MAVGEQDHRVVARTMTAPLGGGKERGDFVAGEVIAEGRFVGSAYSVARRPSLQVPHRMNDHLGNHHASAAHQDPRFTLRAAPFPAGWNWGMGNSQPNALTVASAGYEECWRSARTDHHRHLTFKGILFESACAAADVPSILDTDDRPPENIV